MELKSSNPSSPSYLRSIRLSVSSDRIFISPILQNRSISLGIQVLRLLLLRTTDVLLRHQSDAPRCHSAVWSLPLWQWCQSSLPRSWKWMWRRWTNVCEWFPLTGCPTWCILPVWVINNTNRCCDETNRCCDETNRCCDHTNRSRWAQQRRTVNSSIECDNGRFENIDGPSSSGLMTNFPLVSQYQDLASETTCWPLLFFTIFPQVKAMRLVKAMRQLTAMSRM